MKKYLLFVFPFSLFASSLLAQDMPVQFFDLSIDDSQGLSDVIQVVNNNPGCRQVNFHLAGDGGDTMLFGDPFPGSESALPELTGCLLVNGQCGDGPCGFSPTPGKEGEFRLIEVSGVFRGNNLLFTGFGVPGSGGVFRGSGSGLIDLNQCTLAENVADFGGGISLGGESRLLLNRSVLERNLARIFGHDLDVSTNPDNEAAVDAGGSFFLSTTQGESIDNPFGSGHYHASTFAGGPDAFNSTDEIVLWSNVLDETVSGEQIQSERKPASKPEALCDGFGIGMFESLGYNIASDNSCSLDQNTDLPGTDPRLALSVDGLPIPQPGSQAIDSGAADVIVFPGDTLASLPCDYRDVSGTARPQDANSDGVFECDRGAMEVKGAGAVVAGHSSVFYNPVRSGEGNYVEILESGVAIVYTFTFNPEGTGPAWFLGVGNVDGNSIVLDGLARPIGTPFGDDFDAAEIEYTPAGGMSMIFPDCEADAPGGNIAYAGNKDLGFEGLITRATRLAHITGCGAETPDPNAGLSGSFYAPARSGEGLIVEWLSNGTVLVVFFTYDTDGNQFWLFGQAAPNGKSVTLDAFYPTAFTPWGRNFNAADVMLEKWGTFTLTWTDCNTMTFQYDSDVAGFGAATRNYTRLSKLAGTQCPMFP